LLTAPEMLVHDSAAENMKLVQQLLQLREELVMASKLQNS